METKQQKEKKCTFFLIAPQADTIRIHKSRFGKKKKHTQNKQTIKITGKYFTLPQTARIDLQYIRNLYAQTCVTTPGSLNTLSNLG